MAKKIKKLKFRKEVFLLPQDDGNDGYYIVYDTPEDVLDSEGREAVVGVYQFVEMVKITSKIEITSP